jgi:hypothetical protein
MITVWRVAGELGNNSHKQIDEDNTKYRENRFYQ